MFSHPFSSSFSKYIYYLSHSSESACKWTQRSPLQNTHTHTYTHTYFLVSICVLLPSKVFRTWCRRLHQKQETERRYQTARQTRLHCIFQEWQAWAHGEFCGPHYSLYVMVWHLSFWLIIFCVWSYQVEFSFFYIKCYLGLNF